MPVIGTAGHVDHGKSTLVQALTGRDPDRWDEEKRRGLTIDLGFAWMELPGGIEAGFVDVPGHERFIKNMLAGVDGIDAALFVVAADEGWMPQSEEHLAILDLLAVDRGVVALTRCDLVDDELAQLAALETHEKLEGTSLEGAPIVFTAAPTGAGVAEVATALAAALAASPVPDRGRPRLWVDRSFVIAGAGTVVTGTLTGGAVAVGDNVMLWPGSHRARVRSLQSHEREAEKIGPGNRTALNLAGLDRADVARGAMLGRAGQWVETARLVVELRTIRSLDAPLTARGAYHLHLGSGTWPVRLRLLEGKELAGSGTALVRLDTPLPIAIGDRFILRETGRRAVVAGGRVIDPSPARRGAALRASLPALRGIVSAAPDERAQMLLDARGRAELARLAAESGGGRPATGMFVDQTAISAQAAARMRDRAVELAGAFHRDNPLRPGVPKASLASGLEVTLSELEALVVDEPRLVDAGAAIRRADFTGGWGAAEEQAWQAAEATLTAAGAAAPRASQLGLHPELMHALLREGRLVRIDDDLVYLPHQLDEIAGACAKLGDAFTVADFRDHLGVTRRQAVPLLEWLDRTGVTVRSGDVRSLRRQPPREPEFDDDRLR